MEEYFGATNFFSHIWTAWTTCEKSGTNECEIFLGMLATLILNHEKKFNKNTGYGGIKVLDYFNVIERSTHSLLGSHHFCGTL